MQFLESRIHVSRFCALFLKRRYKELLIRQIAKNVICATLRQQLVGKFLEMSRWRREGDLKTIGNVLWKLFSGHLKKAARWPCVCHLVTISSRRS